MRGSIIDKHGGPIPFKLVQSTGLVLGAQASAPALLPLIQLNLT